MYNRKSILGFLLSAACIALMSCNGTDSEVMPGQSDIQPRGHHVTTSNVMSFSGEVVGTSQLVRKPNSVSMNLHTSGLIDGNAYTVWYFVFNNPSACGSIPCGMADILNPEVAADLLYAAGNVAGNGDQTSFAGALNVGDASTSVAGFFNALFGTNVPSIGLLDPYAAEVQLVVRSHGTMTPEYMPDMISTFNGGCLYPPGVPQDYGVEGILSCEDVQGSIHFPED